MLDVRYSAKFKKDVKVCMRRRYDMAQLQAVVDVLRRPESLPSKNREHNLVGKFAGYRECHIQPDWLLIFRQDETELLLYRTGTHSDLFGM